MPSLSEINGNMIDFVNPKILTPAATLISATIIAYQIQQRKKQFVTEFEDEMTNQYREIAYQIPVDSLLEESTSEQINTDSKEKVPQKVSKNHDHKGKIMIKSGGTGENNSDYEGELKDYYRYIDLSNEQIFLRKEGRIRKSTWENWEEGIRSNLSKKDFRNAWSEINRRSGSSFNEIKNLLDDSKSDDPRYWEHPYLSRLEKLWHYIFNPKEIIESASKKLN